VAAQACAIDNLGVLYERGLSTADIFRVSYCNFNSSTQPACLTAPLHAPPAPPSNSRRAKARVSRKALSMQLRVRLKV
jgi:hypothetical protein